eukprot:3973141-Prymnesium_polylepis.2
MVEGEDRSTPRDPVGRAGTPQYRAQDETVRNPPETAVGRASLANVAASRPKPKKQYYLRAVELKQSV